MRAKNPSDYYVTVDGDTVPGLALAMKGALHAGKQGKGNKLKHLLISTIVRATNGIGIL